MALGHVMFEKQLIVVNDFCNRETSAAVGRLGRSLNQLLTNEHVGDRHDAVLPHSNDGSGESNHVEESHPYEVVPFG